jgi:asparagine synthetase B (glutamine-hydrolysing)
MCGIFNILTKNNADINNVDIHKFIEKIKYRGPDYTNIVRDDLTFLYIHY